MKRILITGADSYVGTNIEKWLRQWPQAYSVDTADMKDISWSKRDFSGVDVIFHVAAIVHASSHPNMETLYCQVNRDLAVAVAEKAKDEGVGQFIFMSTMAVYGLEGKIGERVTINKNTAPEPTTYYGKSKLQAENALNKLTCDSFKVVIVRSPMIYGMNCPGNYSRLKRFAMKTPVFPMINNERSIIHIDRLSRSVREYIDTEAEGLFLPQDDEYANTSMLVKKIAEENGRKIYLSRILGSITELVGRKIGFLNKVFGSLVYER